MNIYYHGARREIIVSKDQSKFPSKCKLLEIEQVRYKLPIPIWKHLYFVFFRKREKNSWDLLIKLSDLHITVVDNTDLVFFISSQENKISGTLSADYPLCFVVKKAWMS